jgi:tRNA (guanine37-N1)-methyltransferase
MRFTVVTLFPELFAPFFAEGLLGKAKDSGLLRFDCSNPRNFVYDRHRTVDDAPYGGGAGMVMKAEPVLAAIREVATPSSRRILLSPQGRPFSQAHARALAKEQHIVLVCGRYEGIDDRVTELGIDEVISLGDFVLNGGEVAAMAIIEAVSRLIPGVIGSSESAQNESFEGGLLEHPHYTRPPVLEDRAVPEVLLSGDHGKIAAFRRQASLERTAERRPELLRRIDAPDNPLRQAAARTSVVLCHHPVYDKDKAVITTAVTNLDIHDIARQAKTYGLDRYYMVTPVSVQREKVERILRVWTEEEGEWQEGRGEALADVSMQPDLEAAIADVEKRHRARPLVVATTADETRVAEKARTDLDTLRAEMVTERCPVILVLGSGYGLTEGVIASAHRVLAPLRGFTSFRHLSVRSASAIFLDRLFGLRP